MRETGKTKEEMQLTDRSEVTDGEESRKDFTRKMVEGGREGIEE